VGRNQMDECHPGWGDFHTIRALMEKWEFGFLCTLDEVVDRAGGKKWTGPTPFLFCYWIIDMDLWRCHPRPPPSWEPSSSTKSPVTAIGAFCFLMRGLRKIIPIAAY
jgi:hypothetical protein